MNHDVSSDQFDWANGQFSSIFALKPDTCAGFLLQPFFGIVGTAVTVIGGSFVLRCLLNILIAFITLIYSPTDALEESSPSQFRFGSFEFALVRSAHLGLCQAAGYSIAIAMNTPTCGASEKMIWALCMCWLLSFPVGFTIYVGYKLWLSLRSDSIKFSRKKDSGSWSAYFRKIYVAEGSPNRFCRPSVIHYSVKSFFAISGAFLLLLGISFASDSRQVEPGNGSLQIILLFAFGCLSLFLSFMISFSLGRRIVVTITNVLAYHLAKSFVTAKSGSVTEIAIDPPKYSVFHHSILSNLVCFMSWIQAKIETMFNPLNLWDLRHRGKWVKKNEMKVFYSELNDRGLYFAVFLLMKNVIIGIMLADNAPLVDYIRKVKARLPCTY
jgi:hypothetical protein